jgi:hypothetical protein
MWIAGNTEWIYFAVTGLLGCVVGFAQTLVGALGPRERCYATHAAIQCGVLTVMCVVLLSLSSGWDRGVVAAGFLLTLLACIERWNRTRARIRFAESTSVTSPNPITVADEPRDLRPVPGDYGSEPERAMSGLVE